MAVVLRMSRHGSIRKPFYRIVAADSRCPRDGRYLEQIGTYNPHGDKPLHINEEKALKWISFGSKQSNTVKKLLKRSGLFDKTKET